MSSPFIQRFQAAAKPPVAKPGPSLPALPVSVNAQTKRYNPFLTAMNNDSEEFREMYGVNRPLSKPMFLGYKEDEAIFAGSRLFILY